MSDLRTQLDQLLPLWAVCAYPEGLFLLRSRQAMIDNPRSVVVAAFPYLLPDEYYQGRNIARFAVPRDYHEVCGARLEQACEHLREIYPEDEFAHYCDHSPLPEVALAEHAGLGKRGRHNLLITQRYGSWVVLGEIVTSAAIPIHNSKFTMHNCDACPAPCVTACPTGALSGAGYDKAKCLSYLSQRKGGLDPEIASHLRSARTAWGCDLCQEACTRNQNTAIEPLPEFLSSAIAMLTPQTPFEDRAYVWRGRQALARNIENLSKK